MDSVSINEALWMFQLEEVCVFCQNVSHFTVSGCIQSDLRFIMYVWFLEEGYLTRCFWWQTQFLLLKAWNHNIRITCSNEIPAFLLYSIRLGSHRNWTYPLFHPISVILQVKVWFKGLILIIWFASNMVPDIKSSMTYLIGNKIENWKEGGGALLLKWSTI